MNTFKAVFEAKWKKSQHEIRGIENKSDEIVEFEDKFSSFLNKRAKKRKRLETAMKKSKKNTLK